jgi:hypothetical protein
MVKLLEKWFYQELRPLMAICSLNPPGNLAIVSIIESLLSINGALNIDLGRYIVFCPHAENLCFVGSQRSIDDLTLADYSNFIRCSRRRYITWKYAASGYVLRAYLLNRSLEDNIRAGGGRVSKEAKAALLSAVREKLGTGAQIVEPFVVLTNMDIRRSVRTMLKTDFPSLPIVSYQELSPDVNVVPLDTL